MWRVLIYLAIIAALAAGAVWLAEQPGSVAFVWDGVSYSVGLAVAALALLVVIAGILLVEAAARIVLNLPQRLSGAARERKKRKAIQALSRGMIAVGSGDENAARRHARDAERYLRNDEPLLLLLKAQAAQIAGDRDKAEAVFQEMAQVQETRVLGLRGLYVEARRRGDADTAWKHASEAARLAPAVDWANEAVLEGLCARGDWRAAIDTVERRAALGLVEKPTAKRQRAVLLTADALSKAESDEEAALASAKEAVRLAPDLVPAAALAGRILGRRLDLRKAGKILEAAWQASPHPDLADIYTHLRAGDSALDRMKRAERLAVLSSWVPEGRIALVRAAIEAREFETARKTLDPLLQEGRPTVRICLLMAELARVEAGSSAGAREWLARAVHAPRDKAWIADGVVSDRWSPISPVSGHLDAFRWETPPELISGAGSSVIDDVVGDLDDRPRTPTGILGAPVTQEAHDAAADAEIIPPASTRLRDGTDPESAVRDADGDDQASKAHAATESAAPEKEPGAPGKPQAAPADEAAAAASPEPGESPRLSAEPGEKPLPDAVSAQERAEDTPSAKSEGVQSQEARAQAVKIEAARAAPAEPEPAVPEPASSAPVEKPAAEGEVTAKPNGPVPPAAAIAVGEIARTDSVEGAPDEREVRQEGHPAEANASGNESAKEHQPESRSVDAQTPVESEEERLLRLSRPPDDPGVSPEEAEQAKKRKQSFLGGLFAR